MTDLRGQGVRVLLIGTAEYSGPSLPSLPSVGRSVAALSAALRERCGVGGEQLRVVLNPQDARTMAEAVAEEAHTAESVLVIYYLGHGLLGPGDELYLSASGTGELVPGLAAHQALPFSAITEALAACRASSVLVVLDCCFSGRPAFGLRATGPVFTLPATHGVYLLASAERLALAPEDQEFTMFSGALISLLAHGDRRGPRLITLDDAYDFLFRTLRERGGPLPRRQAGDRSGELVLAVNPAQPEPEETDDRTPSPGRCPYLGLSAFGVDDAELFRGRERLTSELVTAAANALALRYPLVVVGPSGAGKSSLLHAGLLARLREGPAELPGAAAWPWITLTPGDHPLQALATRLSPDRAVTAVDIRQDPSLAADLAAGLVPSPWRLVLVIDQVEQLFVPSIGAAERAAFLAAVSAIARPPDGSDRSALAVLALRADFYGRAAEYPELLDALTVSQFIVGPMNPQEMREAIEEPAKTAALLLDAGLADIILHELGAVDGAGIGPGALPLLSHALWAIWQKRSGARLTMDVYRAVGRVTGAIATTADETYGALSVGEQDSVRRMLPRLVRVSDEAPDTIRQLERSALLRGLPDQEAAARALDRLAGARLVTLGRDSVRLSHEALIRSWPLLSSWIEADREWLKVCQQLADDARVWQESGQDRSRLYRGGTLTGVRERAGVAGRAEELPPKAADFLAASVRQEKLASTRRTALITTLSVLLVLALAGGGTTLAFQRQADTQRGAALAQLISAEASLLRATDPNLATQLSLVAYQVDRQSGTDALLASQGSPGILDDGEPALDMAQQDGGQVVAVSTGTAIRLLDALTGQLTARIGALATGPVVIGATAHVLVGATGPLGSQYPVSANINDGVDGGGLRELRNQIRLWSIADPAHPRLLAAVPAHATDVVALALSPDERTLVAASLNGAVRIWDIADPGHPALLSALSGDGKAVYSLAFDPRGHILASTGADHEIRLWDLSKPAHPTLLSHVSASTVDFDSTNPAMPHRVVFSADGRYLAGVAGSDSLEHPEIWNVTNPHAPREYADGSSTSTTCDQLMGLAFMPKGDIILSSCGQGAGGFDELDVWQLQPGQNSGSEQLQNLTSLHNLSASGTGGQVLVEASRNVVLNVSPVGVKTWYLGDDYEPGALASLPATTGLVPGTLAFNSSGRPLMADTADISAIRLWSLSNSAYPSRIAHYSAVHPQASGTQIDAQAEGVALSGNGKILAASEIDNGHPAIVLHQTARPLGAAVATIHDLSDGAISLALSSTGNLLAVSDNSNYIPDEVRPPTVKLYSLQDPSHHRLIASLPANTFHVMFSPDDRMLVAFTANMMLSWDVSNPSKPVELPEQHLSQAADVADGAFSPDGTLLAVQDGAGVLWLWHVAHDRLGEPSILQNQDAIAGTAIAFSPNGQTLAVSGQLDGNIDDPAINLWHVANSGVSLEAQWAQPNRDEVQALGFSPVGQALAVEGNDDINLWSTNPAQIVENLCASAGDTITPTQWKEYIPGLSYRPPCDRGTAGGS